MACDAIEIRNYYALVNKFYLKFFSIDKTKTAWMFDFGHETEFYYTNHFGLSVTTSNSDPRPKTSHVYNTQKLRFLSNWKFEYFKLKIKFEISKDPPLCSDAPNNNRLWWQTERQSMLRLELTQHETNQQRLTTSHHIVAPS